MSAKAPNSHFTLSFRHGDRHFSGPQVMAILNITPDSFFAASRCQEEAVLEAQVARALAEGASMLDVGACSTRPGAAVVDAAEEWRRLSRALPVIRRVAPDALLSLDTFRADIARRCVETFGVDIINDISGGRFDPSMFATVASLGVPLVLMHGASSPDAVHATPPPADIVADIRRCFAEGMAQLAALGHHRVILDPGFGFSKDLAHDYTVLSHLSQLVLPGAPLLVGLSRKRMVHRVLGITPDEALNGTTVLHTLALQAGAAILRVHDVGAAVEAVRLTARLWQAEGD